MTAPFAVHPRGNVQVDTEDLQRELLKHRAVTSFSNASEEGVDPLDREMVSISILDGDEERFAFITDELTSRHGGTTLLLLTDQHAEHIGYLVDMEQPEQAIKYVVETEKEPSLADFYIVGLSVTVTAKDSRART